MNKIIEIPIENLIQELNSNKYYTVYNSTSFFLNRGEELLELLKQDGIHITSPQHLKFLSSHHISEFDTLNDAMRFFKSGDWKKVKAPQL